MKIHGPAVVHFSGGRTSGYLLHEILRAHGGVLPDDVLVCFQNTGREMPATLDFVARCASEWGVHIHWLEFRGRRKDGYEVVSHNSASRNGEPFETLLGTQKALPNPVARSCTTELKIRTAKRWLMAEYGWKRWTSVVGLRADEPGRVYRALLPRRDRWTNVCPLATAGVTVRDVADFWARQPFDLQLRGRHEGNCDGCFLKSRSSITRMMADYPERMHWWADMEAIPRGDGRGKTFRSDREDYATLLDFVRRQGAFPFDVFEPEMGCQEWACTD